MIEFNGVRSSMAHGRQEVALEAVHLEKGHVRLRELVDLAVEVGVDVAELVLHGDEIVEHPLNACESFLELVAGLDLAANVELTRGDRVGDVAEVLDGFDDHIPDDDVRGDHRQDRGHQGRRDQDRPVAVDGCVSSGRAEAGSRRRPPGPPP